MNKPGEMIFSYLDTNGDGSGTKVATGNYSVAADDFYISPPDGQTYHIYRMIVHIEDDTGMQVQDYGNITNGISNGVSVLVEDPDSTEILDLTDGLPITTNGEWTRVCYDVDVKSWGSGNEVLSARWTFAASGSPIVLPSNWSLIVRLNDDFSTLLDHTFKVQGLIA